MSKTDSLAELRRRVAGEKRSVTARVTWEPEARDGSAGDNRIRGHAAVFNSTTNIGDFTEEIAAGAFRTALARPGTDVRLLFQHDTAMPLARQGNETLELREDSHGLAFTADVLATSYGKDAVLAVRTGLVDGCSFGFTVRRDEWTERSGMPHRRITEIGELFEISIVSFPAYQDAAVEAFGRELEIDLLELQARAETRLAEIRAKQTTNGATMSTTTQRRRRTTTSPTSPYNAEAGGPSWFRDLAEVARAEARQTFAINAGHRAGGLDSGSPPPAHLRNVASDIDSIRKRLEQAASEERALSDSPGSGGEFFVPHGPPVFVASEFATSVFNQAVIARTLRQEPLPEAGLVVEAPRLGTANPSGTAATVAVQANQGDAASSTDPSTGLASSNIATIAGEVIVDRQVLDRAQPGLDVVLGRELGTALGAAIDLELVNGPASTARRICGLLNITGITSETTTATTPAGIYKALGQMVSDTAAALGRLDGLTLFLQTRRLSWMEWELGVQFGRGWPIPTLAAPAIPTTISTNRDVAICLDPDENPLFLSPPRLVCIEDYSGSGNLQVKFQARCYVAGLFSRRPASIGTLGGTGFAPPSW